MLYEVHVRGFSHRQQTLPEGLRGSYAALASDWAIAHFKHLGVTALSLLPVHQHLDESRLVELGLSNYWGYNTLGFFCPDPRYASTAHPRQEFRSMVRRLHAAGIEVILDVVFNHTPEGDENGPTLSWRGLDNLNWYRLPDDRKDRYHNWSGCGNALNVHHPRVLQMVMDSLRYWVQEMHVDCLLYTSLLHQRQSAGHPGPSPGRKRQPDQPQRQGCRPPQRHPPGHRRGRTDAVAGG